jgi:hypothetical protein
MFRPALVLALVTSTAAFGQSQSPLPPGRAADADPAAIVSVATENTIILTGAGLLVVGIAVYLAEHKTAAAAPAAAAAATTTTP